MSDKSYQIKENNQVMIQGGEKKVMKKILSVALSTAMAFSMFASVAFGDDALNTQQKFDVLKEKGIFTGYPDGTAGLDKEMTRAEFAKVLVGIMGLEPIEGKASFKDKNYKADKWPAPYVEAVYAAGLMEGKNTTKMIFDFNGKITIQEMAKVLVTAQKLEIPTETNNNASDWAKGYVQAAINAGLVDAKANPKANASRSQLVDVAYSIYLAQQKPKVVSYKVSDNGRTVEFTLANSEVVKVNLEKALVPNTDTTVEFKHNNYDYKETVKWVVTDATKVQGVAADNLKEVVVTFDGEVDKTTAELKDNYKLSDGQVVKSAVLNDAKNAVTLTVETSLRNQQKYNLSVSGVKAGTKVISVSNYEFAPVDVKLPEVVSVTGLGTKAVKIVFSEPVKQTYTGSYLLNGQGFYGTSSFDGRELIIKANLPVGEHTLTVANVEDFNGLKSLKSEHKFTVVEDTTAPTIAEATGTLEKLTITFSEDIDKDTLDVANVYHLRGATKVKPSSFTKLAGNKYEFYFSPENALPTYATTIFVEKVKDYSGNQITETSKQVTATVDTERPVVVDARVSETNKSQLLITFSKAIKPGQNWAKLITVKDKDGKVRQVSSGNLKSGANNVLEVNFFSALPEGTNTLEIKGIVDNTVLGNVLQDYSTTFNVGDSGAPKFAGASFKIDSEARRAVLYFNEPMNIESLLNPANYSITFNGVDTALPSTASLSAIESGKGVVIDLPVQIGGVDITSTNWTAVRVQGVKDASGNYLDGFSKNIAIKDFDQLRPTATYSSNNDAGALVSSKKVEVKVDQYVQRFSGSTSDVKVKVAGNEVAVASVTANNTDIVTIELVNPIYTNADLTVDFTDADFVSVAQSTIKLGKDNNTVTVGNATYKLSDKVAPEVKLAANQTTFKVETSATDATYTATIEFTEALKGNINVDLLAQDFVVTRLTGSTTPIPVKSDAANQTTFFEVKKVAGADQLQVVITDPSVKDGEGLYTIGVREDARYIQDVAGNAVKAFEAIRTAK
ncbi:S-layer homology domain-containing protein [Paenibacillus lautus]|uniref:Ig-like domain-containing protein n=1 Tax=Paenibacillus lautus TaxID=1401 RepID=UPI002DBB9B36|nr:S-layer protein [Paenibacillus lautus]MEC0206834.1 S-layer homology domain-containing protein [Paenibacillus lautus]